MITMIPTFQSKLDAYGKKVETFNDVAEFALSEINKSLAANTKKQPFSKYWSDLGIDKNKVMFMQLNMRYSETISNTHNCPFNGVTNWSGKHTDRPRSYPGYIGRIEIMFANDVTTSFVRPIERSGIHTGGGGSGSAEGLSLHSEKLGIFLNSSVMYKQINTANFRTHHRNRYDPEELSIPPLAVERYRRMYMLQYQSYIFLDDFPDLANTVSKQVVGAIMNGTRMDERHVFTYVDPILLEVFESAYLAADKKIKFDAKKAAELKINRSLFGPAPKTQSIKKAAK